MKILFVCRANSGRSQMAMEIYNSINPGEAESAGTHVDIPGQKIKYRPTSTSALLAMQKIGIDMSKNTRRQLEPEMLSQYDHVVVLAETSSIPAFLNTWTGAEMWHIEDTKNVSVDRAIQIRNDLNKRIIQLSKRLHPATSLITN